jgi:hypothetical protein
MAIIESKETIEGQAIQILIETDTAPLGKGMYGDTRNTTDRVVGEMRDAFADGLELSRKCAAKAVESIAAMSDAVRPQEFSIQLAIKLDQELGAIIAKTTVGAQLQVTMKWVKE